MFYIVLSLASVTIIKFSNQVYFANDVSFQYFPLCKYKFLYSAITYVDKLYHFHY